ncbi:CDP-4-dehydro-6-deoxyglucose reductase, E3 [Gammaproteobacteria bacterium]|nr:CDP-4-dehydro-6-deoxyglucose reductase, E3 [Gammaproteobacteria bacterium]
MLDCLNGHGVPVPHSCRAGVCQTCLMRATAGVPPAASQIGLKDSLRISKHFLACQCQPTEDLDVALPDDAHLSTHAIVHKLELLSHDIMLVEVECQETLEYHAGQFINLVHDGMHVRSYSIASVPRLDKHIQLHVRRLPQGRVSGWIHEDLEIGQSVEIRGPSGDCIYVPGKPNQPLLLVGTGSGLAPLYGILRDALDQGHAGPVHLFHGSRDLHGLYLVDELRDLERRYPNFTYYPCLSGAAVPEGFTAGRVHEAALRETPDLKGWRVFLCGHPEMVKVTRKKAFLAGASLQEIHADAFNVSHA